MLVSISRFSFLVFLIINSAGCIDADKNLSADIASSSGFKIKGISIVAPVKAIDSNALVPVIAIHANSIAVMPYAFCSIENPEVRYNQHGQHWGENIDGVIGCIKLAHQKKLSVMLGPHLWIGHGIYTGAFTLNSEKEWQIWENSYQNYMLRFAIVADSMKAEIFCIGTELGTCIKERPKFWNSFIDTIRKTFHGKLTYAANWDDYKKVPFWDKLDYIGVDAYFPLAAGKTPSINSLKSGWEKYREELQKVSDEKKRPVLFTEYGYRNVDFNSAEPWKENEGTQNNTAQSNAYEALYQSFAGKKWFAGGFIWKWYIDEGHHRNKEVDFSPQQKPAEKVIEYWYK